MAKMKKTDHPKIGRRERQILEIVFRLGEASASEVREQLADPPGYDSVRTVLRILEGKGLVTRRLDGTRYIYKAKQSKASASRSALTNLMQTFFEDSAADTMAAVMDLKSDDLTDEELKQLEGLIRKARKEGR